MTVFKQFKLASSLVLLSVPGVAQIIRADGVISNMGPVTRAVTAIEQSTSLSPLSIEIPKSKAQIIQADSAIFNIGPVMRTMSATIRSASPSPLSIESTIPNRNILTSYKTVSFGAVRPPLYSPTTLPTYSAFSDWEKMGKQACARLGINYSNPLLRGELYVGKERKEPTDRTWNIKFRVKGGGRREEFMPGMHAPRGPRTYVFTGYDPKDYDYLPH